MIRSLWRLLEAAIHRCDELIFPVLGFTFLGVALYIGGWLAEISLCRTIGLVFMAPFILCATIVNGIAVAEDLIDWFKSRGRQDSKREKE